MRFAWAALPVLCWLYCTVDCCGGGAPNAGGSRSNGTVGRGGCTGGGCGRDESLDELQERINRIRAEREALRLELLRAQEDPCEGDQLDVPALYDGQGPRALTSSGANDDESGTYEDAEGGHGDAHDHETLIFLFGAVTVGIMVLHLATIPALHSLQFTVVLFAIGVVCGMLTEKGALSYFPMIRRSYDAWVAADPHLLLFTFLPALLCGDAMTIDTHVARRCAAQCFLLAGPGVLIGSFLTTLVVHYVLPYGWDAATSCTVGSILAATDPVAVISLLKELGASPVLTILIQGESLLNDGIAIVLFTVAYNITGGQTYSLGRLFKFAISSILLAGCLGCCIGFAFYLWIKLASDKLCHHSALIQISLTLVCAYWSFIIAEGVFHTSGVLSTVAASLVLAHKMWPVLVDRGAMLQMWHVLETIGNILVLFLAGVLVGKSMPTIPLKDYLSLIVLYVAVTFIRLFVIILLCPILNRIGERVNLADILIMTWGGLRGMVGMALAILVQKDLADGRLSQQDGDRVLFLVGSVAALTMLVNATTCPALTRFLGITRAPEARKVLMRNVAHRARLHTLACMDTLLSGTQAAKTCSPNLVKELVHHFIDVSAGAGTEQTEEIEWSVGSPEGPLSWDGDDLVATSPVREASTATVAATFTGDTCSSRSSSLSMGSTKIVPSDLDGIPQRESNNSKKFSGGTGGTPSRGGSCVHSESSRSSSRRKKDLSTRTCDSLVTRTEAIPMYLSHLNTKLFGEGGSPAQPVDALWEEFEQARQALLSTGGRIVAFRFGKQLEQIRTILRKEVIDRDHIEVVRQVFLETVRANYWEQLSEGRFMVGSSEPAILFNSVNIAKDHCRTKLMDWDVLKKDIYLDHRHQELVSNGTSVENLLKGAKAKSNDLLHLMQGSKSMPNRWHAWARYRIHEWRTKRTFKEQAFAIGLLNAFLEAQCKAQEQTAKYFGDGEEVDSPEEAFVIIESQVQVFKAACMRGMISEEVQLKVNTMWHVHCFAEYYRNFVLEVHETGVLQAKEADALLAPISKSMRQINKDRKNIYALVTKTQPQHCVMDMTQAALVIQRYVKRRKMYRMQQRRITQRCESDLMAFTEGIDTLNTPDGNRRNVLTEIDEEEAHEEVPTFTWGRCDSPSSLR